MLVKELKAQLDHCNDDSEVFIRCCKNPCGNIVEAKSAQPDSYEFFEKDIPCVIIEPDLDSDEQANDGSC